MRIVPVFKSLLLIAAGLSAASAARASDLDEPFFGGGYAPPPGYVYSHGYGARAPNVVVGPVGYDQAYYYGGYQYPAGGYGGGPYRRAAYSAADIYVSRDYAAPLYYPQPYYAYRTYARGYYAPAWRSGGYYNAAYRPYRGLRQRCQCILY